jgi:hypothetical protein
MHGSTGLHVRFLQRAKRGVAAPAWINRCRAGSSPDPVGPIHRLALVPRVCAPAASGSMKDSAEHKIRQEGTRRPQPRERTALLPSFPGPVAE